MAPDPKGRLVGYGSLCRACVGLDMNTRCTTRDLEATTSYSRLLTKLLNVKGGRVMGYKLLCMPTDPSPVLRRRQKCQ